MQTAAQGMSYYPHGVMPYGDAGVATQGFLDMMSIVPVMFIMFFFMLMMGLMRDIAREPGAAREIVVKGVEAGKEVAGRLIPGV